MKTRWVVLIATIALFATFVSSETAMNFLTRGQADTLYCWIDETNCNFGNSVETMTINIQPSLYTEVTLNVSKYPEENYTIRVVEGTHYVFGENII